MASSTLTFLAVSASVLAVHIEAHSYMTDPMPTWSVGYPTTNFAGLIDGQDYLPVPDDMSYGGTPESNTKAYWTAFNASKYTSLKDLADKTMVLQSLSPFGKATAECGFSLPNGTARDLPAEVQWHDFGLSHQGPCEVWCDDKLAFMDENCAVNYPEVPASLPYDVEVCAGAAMIQSYWIALHGLPWQLYMNCVPLTGKVNGTSDVAADSDSAKTPTTTTATATEAPTAVTEAPATDELEVTITTTDALVATNAPEIATDAPEAPTPDVTPAAPTQTTTTPTATEPATQTDEVSSGAKCSRRRN